MNGLDLFSGIGGITLALADYVRPIAYCEQDRYCQAILLSRMQDGTLPIAGVWDDVRTLDAEELYPRIDIIYGGFPCQDISVAGNGEGLAGKRSGLFYEIVRLTKEINPRFVFLENVPAIRTRGLREVVRAFTDLGYDCRWTVVSAKEVGACHIRQRWFLLAHANGTELRTQSGRRRREIGEASSFDGIDGSPRAFTDTNGKRLEGGGREQELSRPAAYDGWKSQPTICRGSDGLPHRVDRIKGLGNAVVPLQARTAFKKLLYGRKD